MPNVASVLKDEIARVARKELKGELLKLRKATAQYRSDIAALKRRLAKAEQALKRVGRPGGRGPAATSSGGDGADGDTRLRFRAGGFGGHRKRLGLSAHAMAKLLGVSAQSIYKWESGKARPRRSQLTAIADLRKLGKREANAKLESLG